MDLGRRFPGVRAYAAYDITAVFPITWLMQIVFRKTFLSLSLGSGVQMQSEAQTRKMLDCLFVSVVC